MTGTPAFTLDRCLFRAGPSAVPTFLSVSDEQKQCGARFRAAACREAEGISPWK